jgi:uracil-DNA glycosylase family 4
MSKIETIVFIGSNPSERSYRLEPFWHNTKSMTMLTNWINSIPTAAYQMTFLNVSNQTTPGNRPLKISEIKSNLPRLKLDLELCKPVKIIALGKTAAKALTLLGHNFYEMPHPSGLNRQLNNKEFIEEKIKGLASYLASP